jgi:uncharacterized membrane protein
MGIKAEWDKAPDWAKLLLAIASIIAIIKWFPIVELLQLFFYIVIIPLGLFMAIGFVSHEAFDSFIETYRAVIEKLKEGNNNPPPVQVSPEQPRNNDEEASN